MKCLLWSLSAVALAGCSQPDAFPAAEKMPPAGSNEMLRAPVTSAEGLEVLISDVVIPPDATVPRHYHPGEEFLYVISGSAIHVEEGKPDRMLKAGDAYVIPPNAIHSPRGGPEGARAIVFRVHVADQPERILVPEEGAPQN
ncbi:MAG: cupin domain-containing protein [Henriciella sp.]|uniref:cupin domain-containing protein n=1 Tax=Henriciella sp. TaxID=1968823 RepID=UPI003C771B07